MKIVIVMAQTLDGKIGKDASHIVDWTPTEDKKSFAAETKKLGVIIMGSKTFDTIKRPLPGRLNLILTSRPESYKEYEKPGLLEFFKGSPEDVVKMLESRNYKTAALGGGARTNAAFLKAGLVDEIILTIVPIIFGIGIGISEGEEIDTKLKLLEEKKLTDDLIQLRYKVIR